MIYLDHHATTPVADEVLAEMMPFFTDDFGNAASRHSFGWRASEAVEAGRLHVASLIGASAREIIFTSGATESNNLALLGVAESYRERGRHIVTCNIEHKSVLDCCRELESGGFSVTYLPVNADGLISVEQVARALRPDTILVSIQMANNEIGTIQPLKDIGAVLKEKNILFHSDITQSVGVLPVNIGELNLSLASFSAHKIYGPKGVGALFVKNVSPRIKLKPLVFGGGHERGLRSGTLNVPGIVGFGKACDLVRTRRAADYERLRSLRDFLADELERRLNVRINGHPVDRLPQNLSVCFKDLSDVNDLLKRCTGLAVSTGAACSTAQIEPSHVLRAIGLSDADASRTLRFGLGRGNNMDQIRAAAESIIG